jgi:hypothetical protein
MSDPSYGPDGRHDDLDSADLDGLAMLVPDDPRSLDTDRTAYLREVGRGPTRLGWPTLPVPVPMLPLLAVLAVIGMATLFLTVLPGGGVQPQQAPLATPSAAPGEPGGLLPDTSLLVNGLPIDAAAVRPAVAVLVPADCDDCAAVVTQIHDQAVEFRLTTVLIGAPEQRRQLAQLDRQAAGLGAVVALDPGGALAAPFAPSGVTVLGIHSDGVVGAVVRDVSSGQRLESALAALAEPAAD